MNPGSPTLSETYQGSHIVRSDQLFSLKIVIACLSTETENQDEVCSQVFWYTIKYNLIKEDEDENQSLFSFL